MSALQKKTYDENCVFNRLLQEKNPKPRRSSICNFETIFSNGEGPAQLIKVQDFLPNYDT